MAQAPDPTLFKENEELKEEIKELKERYHMLENRYNGLEQEGTLARGWRNIKVMFGHKEYLGPLACTVVFHAEKKELHTKQIEDIFKGHPSGQQSPISYLVRNQKSIPELPECRLYVVFVESDEAKGILELPSIRPGELRVKTVTAMKAKRADIVLVYSGESGSKNLPEESLYNKSLPTVGKHPIVKELSESGRFFSIYKDFNAYQLKKLKEIGDRVLNASR